MNRLFASVASDGQLATSAATTRDAMDDGGCHFLFAPEHYEPAYGYPLIVWLHGAGAEPTQLRFVMPHVSTRNYVAVAPRGTACVDDDEDNAAFRWRQDEDHILLARQRTYDAIFAACEQFNVAASKIFLAGRDEGGTMALRLALDDPHRFAGAISLGGPFPTGIAPLCRLNVARRVPVLLAGGRWATGYGDRELAGDLRLLHAAGISVTVRLYPCGDGVTPGMLADVNRWIMRQVCPEQSDPAPPVTPKFHEGTALN
jgi:phospholipase/carboxylesterase